MLFNVVYGMLSLITWSAFAFKLRDLARDWRNKELQRLCLAIATFAAPFGFAAPPVYVRVDALFGTPNISSLIIYTTVEVCLTSFLALLVSWSSAQSKVRLRHRLILGYAIATVTTAIQMRSVGRTSVMNCGTQMPASTPTSWARPIPTTYPRTPVIRACARMTNAV